MGSAITMIGGLYMVINIIIALLILILLYILFSYIIVSIAYKKQGYAQHVEYDDVISPDDAGVPIFETDVKTDDGFNIHLYETDVEEPKGVIILLTGITHLSITQFFGHAKMFAEQGYSSVLVEARSHGRSDGKHITFGTHDVRDVQAAVQYIRARMMYQKLPLTIMGFSMGAATAVNAASTIPEIDALIACAPFSRWDYVCTEWITQRGCPEFVATCLRPCVMIHGRIKFGSDFFKYQPVNTLPLLKEKPAFFIHSTGDKTVLFENHNRLRRVYHGHNAIFWKRPIEDHYVTDRKNFMKPWLDVEYKQRLLKFLHEVQAQHHAKMLASIPNHYQEFEQD